MTRPRLAAAGVAALLLLTGCAGAAPADPAPTASAPAASAPAGRLVRAVETSEDRGRTADLAVRTGTPAAAAGPVWVAVDPDPASRTLRILWTDDAAAPACGAVDTAWVEQAEQRIVVVLTRHAVEPGARCSRLAGPRTAAIRLSTPIGARTLMERIGTGTAGCQAGPLISGSPRPSGLPSGATVTGPKRMCPMSSGAEGIG